MDFIKVLKSNTCAQSLGVVILGVTMGFLVAKLNSPFTILIALCAGVLLLAILLYPQVGAAASIFTIWLEHGLVNYNPAVTLTKVIILITIVSLAIKLAMRKLDWRPVKITIPLFLLLFIMLISDFYSLAPQNGLLKLQTFATQLTIIYLIVQTVRDSTWVKVIFGGIVILSVFQAVQSFFAMHAVDVHDSVVRLSGNYVDPNVFARGLLTSLTFCILFWVLNKNLWLRITSLGISLLFMGAIFFTGSRSSVVISIAITLFLIVLFLRTQGFNLFRLSKQIFFVGIVIALNLVAGYYLIEYVPKAYTQRIINMLDMGFAKTASKDGRALLYYAAAETIFENPVLGVGLSGFRSEINGIIAIYPHNIFLETWAEIGIGGFVFLLMVLFIPFWLGYRAMIKNRGDPVFYQLMMMALSGYVVNLSYAQFIGQITSHKPLWIFMGFLLALIEIKSGGAYRDTSG